MRAVLVDLFYIDLYLPPEKNAGFIQFTENTLKPAVFFYL